VLANGDQKIRVSTNSTAHIHTWITVQRTEWKAITVACLHISCKLKRGKCLSHNPYHYSCTLVQALRLCTGCTAHRGRTGIALLFHDHDTRRGWGVSVTSWPLFTPGKDLVPIVQEAGWDQGPVYTGAKNLSPTRIRSPDRIACSLVVHWNWIYL
jgi:hypothetical protein